MNFEQQVKKYQPLTQSIELVKKSQIVLLVGITGAGKDTIKSKLLKNSDFEDIVSHTTRTPRMNNGKLEQNGREYHFIDTQTASRMIAAREFIEVKLVHSDTIYGTSASEIQKGYDQRKISITDIDVQGVDEYKLLSPNVSAIFLLPPTYEEWRHRLSGRYINQEEFEAEWPKRRESALKELMRALELPYYHFILNDELERSVEIVNEIAHKPEAFNRKDDEARLAARDLLDHLVSLD